MARASSWSWRHGTRSASFAAGGRADERDRARALRGSFETRGDGSHGGFDSRPTKGLPTGERPSTAPPHSSFALRSIPTRTSAMRRNSRRLRGAVAACFTSPALGGIHALEGCRKADKGGRAVAGVAKKSFESPDERRAPDKTEVRRRGPGLGEGGPDDVAAGVALVGVHQADGRHRELPDPSRRHRRRRAVARAARGRHRARGRRRRRVRHRTRPRRWVVGSEPFVCYEFDSSAAESYARS